MREFDLHILESDGNIYDGKCISVVIPTIDGMYGVQAHHANMFSALTTGIMKYTTPDEQEYYVSISGGMVKVEDNEVLVLADSAEKPEEIDENRAHLEITEATSTLNGDLGSGEYSDITAKSAEAMMQRAINRLKLKKRYGEYK